VGAAACEGAPRLIRRKMWQYLTDFSFARNETKSKQRKFLSYYFDIFATTAYARGAVNRGVAICSFVSVDGRFSRC
jgi:hypothetical protein